MKAHYTCKVYICRWNLNDSEVSDRDSFVESGEPYCLMEHTYTARREPGENDN